MINQFSGKRIFKKESIDINNLLRQFNLNEYQISITTVKLCKYISVDTCNIDCMCGFGIYNRHGMEYKFDNFQQSELYGFTEYDITTGLHPYTITPVDTNDFYMESGSEHIVYWITEDINQDDDTMNADFTS